MADRSRGFPWKALAIIGGLVLIGVLVYSTIQQNQVHYEVCVNFRGQSHCATASGASASEAIRSAQEIDCALLANGRDENMVCLDTTPASTRPLTGK